MEQTITKVKNENFEEVTAPESFFYTFKSQKAFNAFRKDPKIELFPDKQLRTHQADHPTNIIWDNLKVRPPWRISSQIGVILLFLVYLFVLTGVLQIFLNHLEVFTYYSTPPGEDCDTEVELYQDK